MDNAYKPSKDAVWKQISPTAHMLLPGVVQVFDEPHPGWRISFDLDFDGIRVSPVGVHVHSDGTAITGTDLRSVAVNDVLSTTLAADLSGSLGRAENWQLKPSPAECERRRDEGPTDANIQYAAELFLFARALRTPASEFVQNTLGMTKPTTARWLRKAREMGLIDGDD